LRQGDMSRIGSLNAMKVPKKSRFIYLLPSYDRLRSNSKGIYEKKKKKDIK
jgi:hypothetical protein